MTPIIILHHNEYKYLVNCIESIEKTLKPKDYKLYIVDNKSDEDIKKKIKERYKKKYNIFFNNKDNWLKGFNLAIDHIKFKWNYIILSDADISFKNSKKKNWLKYLIDEMNEFPIIGKLGISLNTNFIKNKKVFRYIYKREKSYQVGINIGKNVIAPVDTTAAIYRQDLFITNKFKLEVGHTSLMKPNYYSCRTSIKELNCFHLGWYKYYAHFFNQKKTSIEILRKKAWFFCKWNRPIEKSISKQLPTYERIALFISAKFIYRTLYSIKFLSLWSWYIIKNFPFNYNSLQNKANK